MFITKNKLEKMIDDLLSDKLMDFIWKHEKYIEDIVTKELYNILSTIDGTTHMQSKTGDFSLKSIVENVKSELIEDENFNCKSEDFIDKIIDRIKRKQL